MIVALCVFCILLSVVFIHVELLEMNCKEIRQIVDGHNEKRALLAKGELENQPPAINMTKLAWHIELAEKAEEWAQFLALNHSLEHNPDRHIPSKKFKTGENLYRYTTDDDDHNFNVDQALDNWFEEHEKYTFQAMKYKTFMERPFDYGHYTQMIWAETLYIGCGVAMSSTNKTDITKDNSTELWHDMYVVCNYGPPGNVLDEEPYKRMRKGDNLTELICKTYECNYMPYGGKCDPKKYTWPTKKTKPTTTTTTTTTPKPI